jgi:hypothetical protein
MEDVSISGSSLVAVINRMSSLSLVVPWPTYPIPAHAVSGQSRRMTPYGNDITPCPHATSPLVRWAYMSAYIRYR